MLLHVCVLWYLLHSWCSQYLLHLLYVLLYVCILWCLLCTWCCQCLLHLSYVLAICMCCGAWSAPGAVSACCTWHMCWLYVGLGVHLCVGYVVLGAHLCVGYMYCVVLGAHLVQEGSGPCNITNFSHLLLSYGTYMNFVSYVRIDPRQS